jgi:hypothetical protein
MKTGKKSFFQNMRAINAWKEAGVVCSDAGKAWERECGRGFCDDKHCPTLWKHEGFLAMDLKSFYSELQDTQVDRKSSSSGCISPST